ncbi:unnamed protein product [Calicophoron daubneyi]|uniref:C2H2-type domain-containing protein n=1 Tax=Calicophoron daubneyi TaxID=300641 RepID=A0AAV2TFW2_CALDB
MVDVLTQSCLCSSTSMEDEYLTIRCPRCLFEASSSYQLRKHAISSHLSEITKSSLDPTSYPRFDCHLFVCAFCGASTTESLELTRHLAERHSALLKNSLKKCSILSQKIRLSICSSDDVDGLDDSDVEDMDIQMKSIPDDHDSENKDDVRVNGSSSLPVLPNISTTQRSPSSEQITVSTATVSISNSGITTVAPSMNSPARKGPGPSVRPPLPSRIPGQDWSKMIARSDKKFICLLCRRYIYSGRTEVVFHSVTRHLLAKEIEFDLSHYGRLTDSMKRQIGHYFADGMRIRSGVHYKDAKRVEAALFRSIELHLRYRPAGSIEGDVNNPRVHLCSGCGATFNETQVAYAHVNDELRAFLPEFMRARSCPWSLSTREEWVWCVPDLPVQPVPGKSSTGAHSTVAEIPVTLVLGDRIHKPEVPSKMSTVQWPMSTTSSVSTSTTCVTSAAVDVVKSLVAAATFLNPQSLATSSNSISPPVVTSASSSLIEVEVEHPEGTVTPTSLPVSF